MQNVYKLTVDLNKDAILRGMQAHAATFLPKGDGHCTIEDILLVGQVNTPDLLNTVAGEEGRRTVRVLVMYGLPVRYEEVAAPFTHMGVLSHDITLELLRELEYIGG